MYLVFTGNEYGIDIPNSSVKFIIGLDKAEEKYKEFIKDYGCAIIYQVLDDRLELIKSFADFNGDEED